MKLDLGYSTRTDEIETKITYTHLKNGPELYTEKK